MADEDLAEDSYLAGNPAGPKFFSTQSTLTIGEIAALTKA